MPKIRLVIELNTEGGGTTLSGPLNNLALCDHLLAQARRILDKRQRQADEQQGNGSKIVIPEVRVGPIDPKMGKP